MKLFLSEETALSLGKPACHWLKPSLPCKETAELKAEPNLLSYHNQVEKLMRLLPCLRGERKARTSPWRKMTPVSMAQCPWRDGKGARGTLSAAVLPLGPSCLAHVGLSLTTTDSMIIACALKELVGCHAQPQG